MPTSSVNHARLSSVTAGVVAAAWFLLDQATKLLAVARLEGREPIDLGVIVLRVVRNPGGAFSLPGLFPGVFVIVTVVVLVLVVRALPHTDRLWLAAGYGLVTGGALGNCADRLFRAPGFPNGHVVDFFEFGFVTFPVFNVADIGITVGAMLVGILLLQIDRQERARRRAGSDRVSVRPGTPSFGPHDDEAAPDDAVPSEGPAPARRAAARGGGTPAWYGTATTSEE